ncbi:SDR family NAD(P)-dependent oxidoreductase [Flavobacterium zepuense]|uniref:SDR family NAD(P)-dependent oxidoreductase n=1 Tax=Flavobacterium zepuense TaxID=2593302 RepID=A0A552VAQ5_9FLAO|nr:SDR family NAD(P)-dependent oxidoreductase [Flavobacterium zepuense]TRW27563.1 SDR family NAD(P)-dependent oxidoreductase [Flavobacterium zepuense]
MKNNKIWLVTGASQGLGLATVKYLLSRQQTVIATTRNADAFDSTVRTNPLLEVISLDLTSETAVKDAVANIAAKYGGIDMLINNAGYGFAGAVEEAAEEEVAKVMAVNFEASIRMTRNVLPVMRKAGAGHIINLSSIQGLASTPGFGIYNAAKYAVEGFSEALYHEVKGLGIKVTIIEPGAFRTNFLDNSLAVAQTIIADYEATAGNFKNVLKANNGIQPGNPDKAAKAIVAVTEMDEPPLRLLLGGDAYNRATKKLADTQEEFERMKTVSLSTGFADNL